MVCAGAHPPSLPPSPQTHHARRQGLWLFASNALYAGASLVVTAIEAIYLHARGLVRSYGLNEVGVDADFLALQRWARVNKQCVFWLGQLALLPAAWHCVLAWIFFSFLVRGRSPAVMESKLKRRVWWVVLLAVGGVTAVEAACFYAIGDKMEQVRAGVRLWDGHRGSMGMD